MKSKILIYACRLFFVTLCLFLSPSSHAASQDKVLVCNQCLKTWEKDFFERLDRMEMAFSDYRWREAQIRSLYYDHLWQARVDALHPLDKVIRESGQNEEEVLQKELNQLIKQSETASNGFLDYLLKIRTGDTHLKTCWEHPKFKDCIATDYQPIYNLTTELKDLFDHIYEHEREYRKMIEATMGGKSGNYPEDTVETPATRESLYDRFEREREATRFEENRKVKEYFHAIRRFINTLFEAKRCCYNCSEC